MKSSVLIFAILVALCFVGSRTSVEAQSQTVLEILRDRFTTLYSLVENTTLATALNSTGNFTLFAPTNAAFGNFSLSLDVVPVLLYHLSPNFYTYSMLTDQLSIRTSLRLETLGNQTQVVIVTRTPGTNPLINGANIVQNSTNIFASNGIIHAIQSVLTYPDQSASQKLLALTGYSHTASLLPISSFSVDNYTGITFFSPTDKGWSKETPGLYEYLFLAKESSNASINVQARIDLDSILRYNSIGGPVYSSDLNVGVTDANTLLGGSTLSINKPSGWPNQTVVVNSEANVTMPNILLPNGVIHGIDDALLPSTFDFTLEKVLYGLNATMFLNAMIDTQTYDLIMNDDLPRTIFVPPNSAFGPNVNLTREQVLYHVVPQVLAGDDSFQDYLVGSMSNVDTLPGNDTQKLLLTIEKTNSTTILDRGVNGQYIFVESKTTKGNVVYRIQSILTLPGAVPEVAAGEGLSKFTAVVNALNLGSNLTDGKGLTVFAPSDTAFNSLPNGTVDYLLSNNSYSIDTLSRIVENHIVRNPSQVYYSYAISNGTTTLPSGSGQNLIVVKGGRSITVNGANVSEDDAAAANGVVHTIDNVLVPSDVVINLINILEGLGNYNTLLHALNSTNITNVIALSDSITLFAPNDDAFSQVDNLNSLIDDNEELLGVLKNHLVMSAIPSLQVNDSYIVDGNGNESSTIAVTGQDMVELFSDGESKGSAMVVVTSKATGQTAYLYGINKVLGVPQKSSSSGLEAWQIALIVVGGIIVGLIILAVAGVMVYFLFFRHRSGYRRIDDN